jgi:hypothetical protein
MDRRYYFLKVAVVLLAIVTATATGGVASTRMAHAVNRARYSAPAEIQAAAWHTTSSIAHAVAALVGRSTCARS